MDSNTGKIKYATYSFEDFLQDDFFISSYKSPTAESIRFWEAYLNSDPSNKEEYLAAINYLSIMREEEMSQISDMETDILWKRIGSENKKKKNRKLLYFTLTAAAGLALLFFFSPFFTKEEPIPAIISFAETNQPEFPDENKETRLILSEERVVTITEKESVISYDENVINTNEEKISKDEVASYNQLIIPHGKRSVLSFSDGSKVWVNAGTRLIYPSEFEKDKREIFVDGEIYIEVAKDPSRPFYVRTKEMNVQVLGTQFNVTSYETDNFRNVVLVSGSVEIKTARTDRAVLKPNEMFYSSEETENITEVDVTKYISWTQGLYQFESESLETVFKRLSRYYGVSILCDRETGSIKCSGKLDMKDDLEVILQDLAFLLPITYTTHNEIYHIHKATELAN